LGYVTRVTGFIARWDLDKTYLRTDFDTLRDLLRTAVERPDRKRSVPGAAALLRELGQTGARIHILSGSPRQMRSRLEEKLRIDRVRWNELTLKPNFSNMARLRLRALRDQLGYKLPVLLSARVADQHYGGNGALAREVLVGDDAEADAFVYSLYGDLCEGKVERAGLRKVLDAGRVYRDQAAICFDALGTLEVGPVVERILIHLDRQSPPSRFDVYGPRVVPFYNYQQAAFVLAEDGRIDAAAALRVASEFVLRHRFDADALARSYLDLMRRGHVRGALPALLEHEVRSQSAKGELRAPDELRRMCELIGKYTSQAGEPPPRPSGDPDYVELAKRHRGGRNRKRWR
jgi:hypothetical protein